MAGQMRPPSEVAEAVEANVLKRATRILMGMDANPPTQSVSNEAMKHTERQHSRSDANPALPPSAAADEAFARGAAKPARDDEEPVHEAAASGAAKPALASEGFPRTLPDVLSMIKGKALPVDARQLLKDIPALQEWKSVRNPNHKVRDATVKLGKFWQVPVYVAGNKR